MGLIRVILLPLLGESRGPKEKKVARTRSKVKNSDEDGSPKNGQKKVKLNHT